MNQLTRHFISLATAGVACVGFIYGLDLEWYLAAGMSLATYGGLAYFLSDTPKTLEGGISVEARDAIVESAAYVIEQLKKLAERSPKSSTRPIILEMVRIIGLIKGRVKEDPECADVVGFFLEHEAKAVVPALHQYLELAQRPNQSPKLQRQLHEQEKLFQRIAEKMDEHYQKILQHDLMDLEASMGGLANRLGLDEWDLDSLDEHQTQTKKEE